MTEDETLEHIAALAHAGALCRRDEADVLRRIRSLTLPYWHNDRTLEEMRQEVIAALRATGDGMASAYYNDDITEWERIA